MIRRLKHLSCEERLRRLGLFLPGEEKVLGELIGVYKEDGEALLVRVCSNRTSGNGFRLKEEWFRLDIRKKFSKGGEALKQRLDFQQGQYQCKLSLWSWDPQNPYHGCNMKMNSKLDDV